MECAIKRLAFHLTVFLNNLPIYYCIIFVSLKNILVEQCIQLRKQSTIINRCCRKRTNAFISKKKKEIKEVQFIQYVKALFYVVGERCFKSATITKTNVHLISTVQFLSLRLCSIKRLRKMKETKLRKMIKLTICASFSRRTATYFQMFHCSVHRAQPSTDSIVKNSWKTVYQYQYFAFPELCYS